MSGAWALKTHCPNGHPYSGEHLYVAPRGDRQCKTCRRDAVKRRQHSSTRICSIADCQSPVLSRDWCKRHYDRWRRHGDPNVCLKPMVKRGEPLRWLKEHVPFEGHDCLIWPFARHPDGRAHMKDRKPARIMCELAHGEPPTARHEAAHSCGKAYDGCVNPQHLRWATSAENCADKIIHGTLLRGSQLPQAKLNEAQVREIRALKGKKFQRDIAEKFGVNISCVNKILNGQSWRHVR